MPKNKTEVNKIFSLLREGATYSKVKSYCKDHPEAITAKDGNGLSVLYSAVRFDPSPTIGQFCCYPWIWSASNQSDLDLIKARYKCFEYLLENGAPAKDTPEDRPNILSYYIEHMINNNKYLDHRVVDLLILNGLPLIDSDINNMPVTMLLKKAADVSEVNADAKYLDTIKLIRRVPARINGQDIMDYAHKHLSKAITDAIEFKARTEMVPVEEDELLIQNSM